VQIGIENARNRNAALLVGGQMRVADNAACTENHDWFRCTRLRPPLAQGFRIKSFSHDGKPPPSLPTTHPLYGFQAASDMACRRTTIPDFSGYRPSSSYR